MEFYDEIEGIRENNDKSYENSEPAKGITEDFLERLEQEKMNEATKDKSKSISFGSLNDVDYNLEKYNKAKEEYEYRVKLYEKSISKGEKSYNEKLDMEYAKKALDRAKIDLQYAEKYHGKNS
jgi:hypothetical protein